MKKMLKTAVFFGSGPVAATSLELLLQWLPINAVVTKTTPPHHKSTAPVEQCAQNHKIPTHYANTKNELDNLIVSGILPNVSYGIVIDYGVIISQQTIDSFPLGIINSHFSILPEWRGADPITFAILSGQSRTGVSIMRINSGLDTGDILATQSLAIQRDDTVITLTHKLIVLSNTLLRQCIPQYLEGSCVPQPQPDTPPTYSRKLTKQSGILQCTRTATELERQVRAFAGWPTSRLLLYNGLWLTIHTAHATHIAVPSGELRIHNKQLLYGCKYGSLQITTLQPAGKNKMDAAAFINGYARKLHIPIV